MEIEFSGKMWRYQGPDPWHFVTVPQKQSRKLKKVVRSVSPGWGTIPVQVRIGKTEWKTSAFPEGDHYVVPIKASVRKAEKLAEGRKITVRLEVRL